MQDPGIEPKYTPDWTTHRWSLKLETKEFLKIIKFTEHLLICQWYNDLWKGLITARYVIRSETMINMEGWDIKDLTFDDIVDKIHSHLHLLEKWETPRITYTAKLSPLAIWIEQALPSVFVLLGGCNWNIASNMVDEQISCLLQLWIKWSTNNLLASRSFWCNQEHILL